MWFTFVTMETMVCFNPKLKSIKRRVIRVAYSDRKSRFNKLSERPAFAGLSAYKWARYIVPITASTAKLPRIARFSCSRFSRMLKLMNIGIEKGGHHGDFRFVR